VGRRPLTLFQEGAKRVGVISLIGQKLGDAGDQAHTGLGDHAVGGVAGRQDEDPGAALIIDNRMYLAVPTTFREADRLRFGPPFPPLAQRWIFI
jgi:hypothetical protein